MSKRSHRPGREAFKEQRKARKKAQRALRQQQQAQGVECAALPKHPESEMLLPDQGGRMGGAFGCCH